MLESIEKGLSSRETDERREAALRLKSPHAGIADEDAVRLLVRAMTDQSWRVRKTAQDIIFDEYPVEAYMGRLIELLYIEDNAGARNSAIETLTRLGRKSTPFLIEAFETDNADVRKFIIDVLGEFRDPRSLDLMLRALEDEDENVKSSAVEHLGKMGEPSVVDALIRILEEGEFWVAYPAANALGRIGDRRAIPALVAALKKKSLREPSLKALGMLGDAETLKDVVPYIEDKSKSVREEAARVVEAIFKKGASEEKVGSEMKGFFGDRVFDLLLELAWSANQDVRASAILLLGVLKDERVIAPLLDLSTEQDFADDVRRALVFIGRGDPNVLMPFFLKDEPFLRRFICTVAADVAAPEYYEKMIELLKDADGHVRASAAVGLANIGDTRAIGSIAELLRDPFIDVQESAITALARLRKGLDTRELAKKLYSKDPVLKKNIILLMGRLGAEDSIGALGFALKDENASVRRAVVQALTQIKSEESIKYLILALTDEDSDARASAALSLGYIKNPAVFEPLCLLLRDSEDMVKVAASRALGVYGAREAVPYLKAVLSDPNGFVVTTAIDALGIIRGDDAKKALLDMLSSGDMEIRRSAIKALKSFPDVHGRILPFLGDPDWATRVAAVETIGVSPDAESLNGLEKLFDTEEDPAVRNSLRKALNA